EPACGLFLRGFLPLQLLDLIPVPQQLEVLPRREEQGNDEECGNAHRLPQLALALLIDLADDRVVADVFLDRVFEGFRHDQAATFSAARSFALRARGFRSTSSSVGVIGFLVSTFTVPRCCSSARNVCLTMRSSSE